MTPYHPPAPPRQPDDQSPLATLDHMRRCPISALRDLTYRLKMARINFLTRSIWLVNDLPLVREILTDQRDRFPKGVVMDHVLGLLVNRSSFICNGDMWRRRRRMMEMAFGQAGLRRVFPLMRDAVGDMLDRLAARQGTGAIELEMAHVTADIVFRTVFSRPLTREEASSIYDAFRRFQREMFRYGKAAIIRMPRLFSYFTLRRAKTAAAEIRGRLDPLIKARMENADESYQDILATLLAVEDPETGTRFSYDELCEEIATLMLAGHETSSSTLAWSLYLLAKSPDIQERAHAEVVAVAGERPLEFSDMKRLSLVRNIFRETLRLYPPVPFMTRDLARPETLRGHGSNPAASSICRRGSCIAARRTGAILAASIPTVSNGPKPPRRNAAPICPSAWGRRVCLGAAFAMQESTLILAELVRRFRFSIR